MTFINTSTIGFYGHHKCATTWMRGILADVGRLTGRSMATFDNPRQFCGDLAGYLQAHPLDIVAYTNANIEAGLLAEIEFSGPAIDLMQTWGYGQENVLELRYEDVIRDPYLWLLRAGLHWGMVEKRDLTASDDLRSLMNRFFPLVRRLSRNRLRWQWTEPAVPAATYLEIAYRHRFERITRGRKRGQEDTKSHYRKCWATDPSTTWHIPISSCGLKIYRRILKRFCA